MCTSFSFCSPLCPPLRLLFHPIFLSRHAPSERNTLFRSRKTHSQHQGGISHVFLSEFANEEDRKYYLEKDPVHLAFVKSIGGGVKKVQVVDFNPGVF